MVTSNFSRNSAAIDADSEKKSNKCLEAYLSRYLGSIISISENVAFLTIFVS